MWFKDNRKWVVLCSSAVLLGVSSIPVFAEEIRVMSWNVESGGDDPAVIAEQIEDFDGIHLWALCEVSARNERRYARAAGRGEGAFHAPVLGETGGDDRLLIIYNTERFDLLDTFQLMDLKFGGGRAPLVAKLRDKVAQQTFLFVNNHLHRTNSLKRNKQAKGFRQWAAGQSLPIIAVGDYNLDFEVPTGPGNTAFDLILESGVLQWVKPAVLVPTQYSDGDGDGEIDHNSVLDFVFVAGSAKDWDGSSEIVVRAGDFPDTDETSDHRPLKATFDVPVLSPPAAPAIAEGPAPVPPQLGAQPPAAALEMPTLEAFPEKVQIKLEARARENRRLPARVDDRPLEFVLTTLKRWEPGQTVKVAFRGGTHDLHGKVANAAAEWTKHGDIKFDFGYDEKTGKYRTWDFSDTNYAAELRVSFDLPGYWSLVGTDSNDPTIIGAGEASLNLSGFHQRLPNGWSGTVLHEFGHALGFQHEHQHPSQGCDTEFRWDDDPGYTATFDDFGQYVADSAGRRPGIYTVLSGFPNFWPQWKVDHNLRQLRNSSAYQTGTFDASSIMKYFFPAWMFTGGVDSHCYTGAANALLSEADKEGCRTAYPPQPEEALKVDKTKMDLLNQLLEVKTLSVEQRAAFSTRQKGVREKRPSGLQ